VGWSGRAPAPPAIEAGKGRAKDEAHVSADQRPGCRCRHRYRQELVPHWRSGQPRRDCLRSPASTARRYRSIVRLTWISRVSFSTNSKPLTVKDCLPALPIASQPSMAKLESAVDLAGKHVRSAAEITIVEDHQSAPTEKRSVISPSGVADPAVRIICELKELQEVPSDRLGTGPYTPPEPISR